MSVATLSHRTACQASLSSYTHATPVTTIYLTSVDGHSNEPPRYDSPFLSSDRSSSSSNLLSFPSILSIVIGDLNRSSFFSELFHLPVETLSIDMGVSLVAIRIFNRFLFFFFLNLVKQISSR